jgi:AAA+ superfamily predicted ATPase
VSEGRLDGLRAAVELSPDNHALRLVLAEALRNAGRGSEALDQFAALLEVGALPDEELVGTGTLALDHERLALAARCLEAARSAGVASGTEPLRERLQHALGESGALRGAVDPAGDGEEEDETAAGIARLVDPLERVTFADVGGLDEVKKAIHKQIVLPFQRPDLYERYGRRAGGGVLLFGPPGCGKTLLARATAGECGLPFLNLRMEDVMDPWYGVSEQHLHSAFVQAREQAPCVLFVDELDALAYARRKQQGSAGRALVDQLLQELDAIGSDNQGMLVLAATNAPWDVDDALKRPGRFDRVVFVPPPDHTARARVLELMLAQRPAEGVRVDDLAARSALFSGADLRAVVERAIDAVIDDALEQGGDVPIGHGHLERALADSRPTTVDWLRTARNFVEFANDGGRYDDVLAFLRSPEGKAAKRDDAGDKDRPRRGRRR